jgi:PAS domain S-box-containing protein
MPFHEAGMIERAGTFLFAVAVAGVGCAAFADVYVNGALTVIDPLALAAVAVCGVFVLLISLMSTRSRAVDLEGRTDRLTQLTSELESTITALEAANTRLHASEARYKGLVDAQGDAILRRTPDGRLTYANEAFYRMFGLSSPAVIGNPWRPEPHPDSPPPVFGRFAGRETGRERVSYDQHVKTVAGYRWIAWEDYAIRDNDGRLVEMQSVGRDITERKRLESELTDARDKAQEASRSKSHFLATMSHEIRTPMNGVLGMARLLLETEMVPDQRTYAEAIRQSGMALLSLIEEILDFSKIESGALVLEKGPTQIRTVVEDVSELLATRAHAKGIEFATAIAADVPDTIETDAMRFRQIVTNLVGNAIKFTVQGGVLVKLSVVRAEGEPHLCLEVRDTGVGVPPEKQAQIFDEFVQADSSHARRYEGTGLGLAISRRLVEAMDGSISLVSGEEKGSIFSVLLPYEEAKARKAAPAKPLAGKRLAVISPSPLLRAGLKMQLHAAGAMAIEGKSVETLRRVGKNCDMVLFDLGIGADAEAPSIGLFGGRPFVALVTPEQRGQLATLSARGFSAYLTKPIRQASLERRLASVLAGEEETQPIVLRPHLPARPARALSILLAEDNPVNALLARELLRRRGHSVREVSTGAGAVAACGKDAFDLVIMDVHMPGLDGIEATRRIRAAERVTGDARVPIYALTADALETGRHACLEAGMNGFLTKPVDPAELDAVLADVVPREAAA